LLLDELAPQGTLVNTLSISTFHLRFILYYLSAAALNYATNEEISYYVVISWVVFSSEKRLETP